MPNLDWMSDNGREYIDKEYEAILRGNGIQIERSVPHQPQMNGQAERFNHTIDEKSEVMRHHACIPDNWWEFSVIHAVYLYNRTLVHRLDWKTPYEIINGDKPDISHLKVFGCGAYVLLPPAVCNNKLLPKSELMTFLRYNAGTAKNTLFMHAPNNVLFSAATALFDELLFPKCEKPSPLKTRCIRGPSNMEEPIMEIEWDEAESDDDAPHVPPIILPSGEAHDDAPPIDLPQAPPPTDAPGGGNEGPRWSTHLRTFPKKDGNVYPPGTTKDTDRRKRLGTLGSDPNLSTASSSGSSLLYPEFAKLAAEGGELYYIYLCLKALQDSNVPDPMDVQEWTTRDLKRLPAEDQQEWHGAQEEELEALTRRKVYELANLPPG